MVFVFDFGFGESGAIKEAPVHGLAAAVDVTFFHEIEKGACDGGFILMAHRQVGIIPAAENAEALVVFFVLFDVAESELAAERAEFRGRNFSLSTQLFFHLGFNWQAMAIPAWHVGCVMPGHALGLDDQVLEDFVQARAEVNFASGIWRAVMQNKERLAFPRLQIAFVTISTMPGFELLGLVLRQAGLHRKIRFRQVQGLLEFEWFGHKWSACKSLLCRPFVQVYGGKHPEAA